MKQRVRKWLAPLLAAAILLAGVSILPVGASDPQVWEDDFASDKGGSYTPYGYWWNLDGQLRAAADDNATGWWTYYYLKDLVWDDVVVEFDVVSQTNTFGVVLRAGDPGPEADQGNGYAVMYDMDWAFVGSLSGSWVALNTPVEGSGLPTAYQPGSVPTHWKVEAEGNEIRVYFNGSDTPAMAVQSDLWSSGQIGFRALTYGGQDTAVLKNLSIREIVDTPPTTTTTEEPATTTTTEKPTTTTSEQPATTTTEEPVTTTSEQPVTTTSEEPATTTTEKPATTTTEQPVVPEEVLVWEDDFESEKGGSYTPYGLWWNDYVSANTGRDYSGVLANEGGATTGWAYYYLKDMAFDDFIMEFDVVEQISGQFGVVLRAGDPGPGDDQGDGYAVMYDTDWAFVGTLDGTFRQIQTATEGNAYACQPGSTANVHWKIVAEDNVISVYFNGAETPSIQVTDDTYHSGAIGFRVLAEANQTNVILDNLTITELKSGEPGGSEPGGEENPDTGDPAAGVILALCAGTAALLTALLATRRRGKAR